MTPEQQAQVVESLPGEVTDAELAMPEGDLHSEAKVAALQQLKGWFQRQGRSVYVAMELPVYYPRARRFAPDLLVVLDVPTHKRRKWVVQHERRKLDWVLEVHVGGDRKKDAQYNVRRYAQLGIPEYFIFDRVRQELTGYRLKRRKRLKPGERRPPRKYVRMRAKEGRYHSRVLGLMLQVVDGELEFTDGEGRVLLGPAELAQQEARQREEAERRAAEETRQREEAERRAAEQARQREEAERRVAEAERRAAEAERLVAELQARLAQLKQAP